MKKTRRILKNVLKIYILYIAVCMVLPPLFHKMPNETEEICETEAGAGAPERVRSIDDNQDALLWRLRLIELARERIVLATFDFRDDNSGKDMMAALLHAAGRGVKVQILVDGMNAALQLSGSRNFRELSAHENVEVKLYNPLTLIMPWKNNYRMHDKYLIADDFAYILGGRNTDDLFLGKYAESYNEDRDILVFETVPGKGNSFGQLLDYFDTVWNLSCCRTYERDFKTEGSLTEHYRKVREMYGDISAGVDWENETCEADSIELCTNPVEPQNKVPRLWERMVTEMKMADRVLIQTPYIICSGSMYQDLRDICLDTEKTEIIVNAVESGSNPFGCTDYLNQKEKISSTGVYLYEYLNRQALHTKTILAGETLCMVGSCNMDMRSVYLDTEMMLFIESKELNEDIRQKAEKLKQFSREVSPEGIRSDGEKYQEAKQGWIKKMIYSVLRIVLIPFRHLL